MEEENRGGDTVSTGITTGYDSMPGTHAPLPNGNNNNCQQRIGFGCLIKGCHVRRMVSACGLASGDDKAGWLAGTAGTL